MNRSILMAMACAAALGACAAPGRDNLHASQELTHGHVAPANVGAMTDCLLDGFNRAHWVMTRTRVAQQQRSDGTRVETYAGNGLLISADVMSNGDVALVEMSNARLVNTSGEREAFAACLARYASAI